MLFVFSLFKPTKPLTSTALIISNGYVAEVNKKTANYVCWEQEYVSHLDNESLHLLMRSHVDRGKIRDGLILRVSIFSDGC